MVEANATVGDINCEPDDVSNIALGNTVPDVTVNNKMVDDAETLFEVDPEGSFADAAPVEGRSDELDAVLNTSEVSADEAAEV